VLLNGVIELTKHKVTFFATKGRNFFVIISKEIYILAANRETQNALIGGQLLIVEILTLNVSLKRFQTHLVLKFWP